MRIIHIDNYDVCEENGKFIAATFKDYDEISHSVEITEELENYFKEVRKEEFKESYRERRYIDEGINDDEDVFEIRISLTKDGRSAEDIFLEKDFINSVKKEIEKLPKKQSRRVYLKLIDEFTITEISIIEKIVHSSISESTQAGVKKVAVNLVLKNIL